MYKKINIFSLNDNRGSFKKIIDNKQKKFSQFFITYSKKKYLEDFIFTKKKINRIE